MIKLIHAHGKLLRSIAEEMEVIDGLRPGDYNYHADSVTEEKISAVDQAADELDDVVVALNCVILPERHRLTLEQISNATL